MKTIPYGRHQIDEDDIESVIKVLKSNWLTQGPVVEQFERAVADYCSAKYAVAVASGTAALHIAVLAAGFEKWDTVITSPNTFVATANSIVYSGATPNFVDIDPTTLCIDPKKIKDHLSTGTRGIIPVHFAGNPCDMSSIRKISRQNKLVVIEDAAHALGATYTVESNEYKVGSCSHSDMTIFSFHPVKHITTGEGGVVTTNDKHYYKELKLLRTHGITKDPSEFTQNHGPWYYEQQILGFNYRITDIQCALGISQLNRLDQFIERRRQIVQVYNKYFRDHDEIILPQVHDSGHSSWHLYIIGLRTIGRKQVFEELQRRGIGVQVHYLPVHLHPYYRNRFHFQEGNYPETEAFYKRSITLPLFPAMTDDDIEYVAKTVLETIRKQMK